MGKSSAAFKGDGGGGGGGGGGGDSVVVMLLVVGGVKTGPQREKEWGLFLVAAWRREGGKLWWGCCVGVGEGS
ncbi:hypothetical protein Pmani_035232 [Petrolisthes manimaculis]|uniref:Uncharacterized protein n=1 Tax=Petrolisthes manimaculis TaxID=1843537 RepID=A0AAE1NMS0_9EUCA|nr:hypothetical protein Pmani_035232 [Petrolisthes manimaculis]